MRIFTIFLITVLITACASKANLAVPITISASGVDDPCGAVGIVVNTKNGTHSIRDRPDTAAIELLTIPSGGRLLLCEKRDGWYGVVVLEKEKQCLDGNYNSVSQTYLGPCDSGWIQQKFVEYFAG